MSLKTLTGILKSGNSALLQKLRNLLTEDCNILEYTDDAVLFQKNNYLVIAKFNHNLAESKLDSDSILDNEVINISAKETQKELKENLLRLIDNLVEDNYVDAEDDLKTFCEQFYQYQVLKTRFPQTFVENLTKKAPGFKLRKRGSAHLAEFKSDVFALAAMGSENTIDVADYASLIENCGSILFLGKTKIFSLVEEAVLGNTDLATTITDRLFETAKELHEINEELNAGMNHGYKLDDGKFDNEEEEDVASEDYASSDDVENEFPEEDEENKEFEEFDPTKLSDEEYEDLHKTVLLSVLTGMAGWVSREANNSENIHVSPDLDDKLKSDIEELENPELAADTLSDIEARWNPLLSHFIQSDLYTPEQEIGAEEIELKDDEEGEEPETNEDNLGAGDEGGEMGEVPETPDMSLPTQEEDEEHNEPSFQ